MQYGTRPLRFRAKSVRCLKRWYGPPSPRYGCGPARGSCLPPQRAKKKLHGAAAIGQAVGAVLGRRKMAKHFQISISDDAFGFARNDAAIAAEAALDGIYVVRTNLPAAQSDAAATQFQIDGLHRTEGVFHAAETFVSAHRR